MSRFTEMPRRAASGAMNFINPRQKAGRIPLTRTVLVLQLIGALVFVGYTLVKKDIRLPFSPEPYLVDVVLPDGAGLDPGKEPLAGVAGAAAGRVVGVEQRDGQAVATLRLEPELRGKIFADATASLRPINVLQVLNVNILPGDPASGPLPEGQEIPPDRTDVFVDIDELTSVLDADTQAQVQILISEAANALRDREPELRKIIGELADLSDAATPLARALNQRRELLAALTDDLDTVFSTLGERGVQLAEISRLGRETLEVSAEREPELTAATRLLAPTLLEARSTLAGGRELASSLVPALDQVLPVTDRLQPAADEVLDLIPRADGFLDTASAFVRDGARPLSLFEQGTRGLGGRVRRDLIPAIDKFGSTIGALDKFKGGIAQTADLWSRAFSQNNNLGTYTQVLFGNGEMTPEGLGLEPADARSRGRKPARMHRLVAKALELACEENIAACVMRVKLPGLPAEPLLRERRGGGA